MREGAFRFVSNKFMQIPGKNAGHLVLFLFLLVASFSPVWAVDIPAMVDYPNHLARMYVLSRAGTAAASPFYQITWELYPNLGMDLTVPWLARWTGVSLALKAFYSISQTLLVSGAVMLELVVKRRIEIAHFAAVIFLYSFPFAWGFLNFEFGLGIALWALVTWLIIQDRPLTMRAVVHCVFVTLLYAAHLFALGIYGAAVGMHELWRIWYGRSSLLSGVITLALLFFPAATLLAVTMLLGGAIGAPVNTWYFADKIIWLFAGMSGYSYVVSAAFMGLIIITCFALRRHGELRLLQSGAWIAAGFAIIFFAMPFRLFDVGYADVRMITGAAFVLPAFTHFSFPKLSWRRAVASAIVVLTLANLLVVWSTWLRYRSDYKQMIASFALITKGSIVLVADSGRRDPWFLYPRTNENPMTHAPTLAVAFADAFVSSFFAQPGKQPMIARPAYEHLVMNLQLPIGLLRAIARGEVDNPPPFLRSWPDNFDYIYIVGPRLATNPLPGLLSDLSSGSRFVLYKIEKRKEEVPNQPPGSRDDRLH